MTYTRRAAAMALLGSGTVLVAGTLGSTNTDLERETTIDVAGDADAYLGLVAAGDGVDAGGVLFESDRARTAPATFTIANRLADDVTVSLASATERLHFARIERDGCRCDGARELDLPAFEPGTSQTIAVAPSDPVAAATDVVRIRARTAAGATTADARRPVSLDAPGLAVVSDARYATTVARCHRPGSLTVAVADGDTGKRLRCTRVAVPSFRPGGRLVVRVEPSPSADRPTVSVTPDGDSAGWAAGADRSTDAATVRTAPGVTATIDGTGAADAGRADRDGYAVVIDDGAAESGGAIPVATVAVPASDR